MNKLKFYLLLPVFAVLAFGSVSFAQEFDREAFKAELRAELKAELKKELLREIKEELKAEILSETKAEVQEVTLGLRDVMNSDFKAELRAEIMEETRGDISSQIEKALAGSSILSGLFKGVTVGGFMDTNFLYNIKQAGESPLTENAGSIAGINFIGENDDNTFALENFALFLDKEVTDEDPIGWQFHTYMGEKAKRITFFGERAGAVSTLAGPDGILGTADDVTVQSGTDDTARNDLFTIVTANISWNAPVLGKHIKLTMGKFYTWIGYELVENIGNPNYSHGTVYNNAIPFTHMGVSADVSEFLPSDKLGLTLYLVNGWDSFIDNNESKSYGFYTTYTPNDDFFISLGGIIGNEGWNTRSGETFNADPTNANFVSRNNGGNTMMYDIVINYSLPQVEKLSLGFNWDHGYVEDFVGHDSDGDGLVNGTSGAHWWAAVGYAMYDFTDAQQGAFRYEYFDDTDGAKTFGYSMWTLTYTHNITISDHLLLRPEVRYNKFNVPKGENVLTNGDKGRSADNETILGVGIEYVF